MLFDAWLHGGENPYRLYNLLDEQYRPIRGGGEPRPPLYPSRVRAFIYGCAEVARQEAITLAGGKLQQTRQV